MRILVDQSGYDLLNIGDSAMLQACLVRLSRILPAAQIKVVCRSPERLQELCPSAETLGPSIADRAWLKGRSQRTRLGSEQIFKMTAPYLPARTVAGRAADPPATIIDAVRWADVVIAAGGGYLADPWWWHGSGVLSVLSLAQRLGRPTAMFSQGIGPLNHPILRRQARGVLPGLQVLGLREGAVGLPLLRSLPGRASRPVVTGDDALELACTGETVAVAPDAIGLNIRYARYTGLGHLIGEIVGSEVAKAAKEFDSRIIALPVSRYPGGRDLDSIAGCLNVFDSTEADLEDLSSPADLLRSTQRCRAVVSASYHAAVFALAQGIPVVCLTRSAYYDAKFAGLAELFPTAVSVVSMDDPGAGAHIAERLRWAWELPAAERDPCRLAATEQVERGRNLYLDFAEQVEGFRSDRTRRTRRQAGGPTASAEPAEAVEAGSAEMAPDAVRVVEAELSIPLPDLPQIDPETGRSYARALILVRLADEPLGMIEVDLPATGDDLAARIRGGLSESISERTASLTGQGRFDRRGLQLDEEQRTSLQWRAERKRLLRTAPPASIVVCTRDRAERLGAMLDHLATLSYPEYEIVVVDNAPRDDSVARVVADRKDAAVPVRRIVEHRPGLSWARNAGLEAARYEVVAYLDDDERPDIHWLAELARGFAAAPDVVMVSGPILPRSLETPAARLFEEWGGHFKGRGFRQEIFDVSSHSSQHPLLPLPPFVAGGNMAVDRAVFRALGGFDTALGAGTPSRAGEDTAAAADVMRSGHTVVWQPSAFVYHNHYDTFDGLSRQLCGYGAGITGFYTRMLVRNPSNALIMIRLLPTGLRQLLGPGSLRNGGPGRPALPTQLKAARRRGMVAGPYLYLKSVRRQRMLSTTLHPS